MSKASGGRNASTKIAGGDKSTVLLDTSPGDTVAARLVSSVAVRTKNRRIVASAYVIRWWWLYASDWHTYSSWRALVRRRRAETCV